MKFAITPCPNDTFSYHALISGAIASDLDFVFEDIETLNTLAKDGTYPVTKLSFAAYANLTDKYELLDAGAAMGIGTGPVLVGKRGEVFTPDKEVLVPGLNTTAALLMRFYAGKNLKLRPMMFRGIADAVSRGEADFGVLIHEGRFVYEEMGLKLIEDLGKYWTDKTSLPVPLGCICIRRDCLRLKDSVETLIRKSINAAFDSPESALPYVKSKAQYLADDVLQKHIWAFVNKYSLDISPIRWQLLTNLEKCS